MSFSVFPVFLAFALNRCSVRFFTTCRCILDFSPFFASLLFGLALVAILVKHPELYPCWLRRVNLKIMFIYELFASLIFFEIGFCLWNSLETFIFFRLPAFFEEHCTALGDLYINIVESPIGVSIISNGLALSLLLLILHITKVCNFNLLLKKNGIHKFFADAGLTSKICRHHRDADSCFKNRDFFATSDTSTIPSISPRINLTNGCLHSPKMLRSGKKIY